MRCVFIGGSNHGRALQIPEPCPKNLVVPGLATPLIVEKEPPPTPEAMDAAYVFVPELYTRREILFPRPTPSLVFYALSEISDRAAIALAFDDMTQA